MKNIKKTLAYSITITFFGAIFLVIIAAMAVHAYFHPLILLIFPFVGLYAIIWWAFGIVLDNLSDAGWI